ncbi:FimV/HubP family polar landmark protein [Lysobacter humi (ex Lee et al. 2017)]
MTRTACLLALALASGSAAALGLGQIQVRSAPGEPLVADIPVVTSDPNELVELQASLASPSTFTRVGLEPPIGVVADLQFTVAKDAAGRPIIRVTSSQPVTEPVLTFLVEVDWGQGRLVREYSAVVDTPGSVAAAPVEPVQAPVVATPQVIERPPVVVPAPQAPRPAPVPEATPAAPVAATSAESPANYRVRQGDTLSRIAAQVAPDGATAEQTMIGLLRANPGAFIGGDINQLRRGAVLRVPASAELEAVEAREAATLVRTYSRRWREARTQPQAPVAAAVPDAAPAAAPRGRLEILPPGAGRAAAAGTQSGIAAGGEGDMLRQELQQTKETLAARDAELQELRSRVADLEKLQADQQKLIALKDAEMAAAQKQGAQAPADPGYSSPLPWIAGGALVLLGLAAAAWNRRRARLRPAFVPTEPRPSVADAFANSSAPAATGSKAMPMATTRDKAPAPEAVPSWQRKPAAAAPASAPVPAAAPAVTETPRWAAPAGASAAAPAVGSVDHLAEAAPQTDIDRLELAQAYLDLGDADNARRLLGEVADGKDATARTVATRMLRDIG